MNKLGSDKLVIATHNDGKLREFAAMLHGVVEVISAGDLGLPEPEETGATFIENALLKANAAATVSMFPSLADDSGLCVNALGGCPGLFSGRYAEINGPNGIKRDFPAAMQKLHAEIGDNKDRSAYFISVLVLARPDGAHEVFEGRVNGTLAWPPRGTNGHGYDPLFIPDGETRTFGEMTDSEKSRYSHRGIAVRQFIDWVNKP